MTRLLFISLLFATTLVFDACSQQQPLSPIQKSEQEVLAARRYWRENLSNWDSSDIYNEQFTAKLLELLRQKESFTHPFDSLKKAIYILRSADGKLVLYSWDRWTGGSHHFMSAYAQFLNHRGEVIVQQVNVGEEEDEGDNVYYDSLYDMQIDNKTAYLATGWGTYGEGEHFVTAEIFKIENDSVVNVPTLFEATDYEGKDYMATQLRKFESRSTAMKFEYDAASGELTYSSGQDLEPVPGHGRTPLVYQPQAKWKLVNGIFKKRDFTPGESRN